VLVIFLTSFAVVGTWFIFKKLHMIDLDVYLLSLHLSLKLVACIISAVVEKVSLDDCGICLALCISLSFVLHGCPLILVYLPPS
jgi:hypothetical protein